MSFSNQKSSLITDSLGNIYNFLWDNEELIYIYFDKKVGNSEKKVLIEGCRVEFDTVIDEKDMIYVICQKKDGSILLLTLFEGEWKSSILVNEGAEVVYNLSIDTSNNMIHIIYCVYSNESDNVCRIYHHFYHEEKWVTNIVEDIKKREILNHFQLIKIEDNIVLGYYNLEKDQEQIYIKIFNCNNQKWSEEIKITDTPNYKLYLDILATNKEELHFNYSEYSDGNLIIKYEKHKLYDDRTEKIYESTLSNPANCSYPTLVAYRNMLWSLWTEYDYLASCYSTDSGQSWSNPYIWNDSKKATIIRYSFSSNQKEIKGVYNLNHSFGKSYPDIEFIGFGSLDNTAEIPITSKKKEDIEAPTDNQSDEIFKVNKYNNVKHNYIKKRYDTEMRDRGDNLMSENSKVDIEKIEREIEKIKNHIKDLERRVSDIEALEKSYDNDELKKIDKRIEEIENYLRRRRSPLFGPRV